MEKIFGKRVMALTLIIGMAMVAFLGLAVFADVEPPLVEPTVTVTDTFAPDNDMNAYVGDTFHFMVDGYGAAHNNSNISAKITIGPLGPFDMAWNMTEMYWEYSWMPDMALYVGTHTVTVEVMDANNMTNMNSTDTMITIWHPVMPADGYTIPNLEEDMTWGWNLTKAFMPVMDEAGNFLTFGVGPEGFPADWTFNPITDDDGYPWWEVTPPMNFEGSAMVNVTATDTNGNMDYMMFELMVDGVNDQPMIEYLMVGEVEVPIEWYNYTWVEDDTNMSEWRWVANLSFEEDGMASFMVSAMDIETDMWNLTYELLMPDAPITIENDLNETNVTIPYNFTVTGDADANGMFWGTLNVTDGDLYHMIWIMLEITPMNDAPTADMPDWDMMQFDIKTGEMINKTLSGLADVDGDDVMAMWYIDGTMVADWEEIYFAYTWDAAGTYNVSAKVSDGTEDVDVGYFIVEVTIANTAPVISSVTIYPVDIGPFDMASFLLDKEVEEGEDVELTCTATDAEGDTLTYTWTHDQDSGWFANGSTVVVSADDLQKGLTYTFTCTVTDGTETVTEDTIDITIVKKTDTEGFLEALGAMCIILIVAPILLLIIIIVIIVMKKKGKKEEPAPEEPPMEEEMPMEGGEEMPMEGEVPMEEGMEEPMMEQPVAEEPVPAPEEPVPAPEEPVPAPEEPVPAPEEPVPAPEEPVPAPEEPVPEQPPAPPEPPMPPQ